MKENQEEKESVARQTLEEGLYRKLFTFIEEHTLAQCLTNILKRHYDIEKETKAPGASELVQIIWVILGLIFYFNVSWLASNYYVFIAVSVLLWYRLGFEIIAFAIHWILSEDKPLFGYGRSIICFAVNLFEVALYTSLLGLIVEFKTIESFEGFKYFYEHLRGIVSFEVRNTHDSLYLQLLSFVELTTAALLISVIIANLIKQWSRPLYKRQKD